MPFYATAPRLGPLLTDTSHNRASTTRDSDRGQGSRSDQSLIGLSLTPLRIVQTLDQGRLGRTAP